MEIYIAYSYDKCNWWNHKWKIHDSGRFGNRWNSINIFHIQRAHMHKFDSHFFTSPPNICSLYNSWNSFILLHSCLGFKWSHWIYEWIVCGSISIRMLPLLISHDEGKWELSYYVARAKDRIHWDALHIYYILHMHMVGCIEWIILKTLFWLRSH